MTRSGYYFWGLDFGAASICRELGFPGGFLTEGTWNANYWNEFDPSIILQKDAVVIGMCFPGQAIDECSGGQNLYTVGGTPLCKYFAPGALPEEAVLTMGGRNEGNPHQFRVTCSSFGTTCNPVFPAFLKCVLALSCRVVSCRVKSSLVLSCIVSSCLALSVRCSATMSLMCFVRGVQYSLLRESR